MRCAFGGVYAARYLWKLCRVGTAKDVAVVERDLARCGFIITGRPCILAACATIVHMQMDADDRKHACWMSC